MSQLKEKNLCESDTLSPHFQTLSAEELLGELSQEKRPQSAQEERMPLPQEPELAKKPEEEIVKRYGRPQAQEEVLEAEEGRFQRLEELPEKAEPAEPALEEEKSPEAVSGDETSGEAVLTEHHFHLPFLHRERTEGADAAEETGTFRVQEEEEESDSPAPEIAETVEEEQPYQQRVKEKHAPRRGVQMFRSLFARGEQGSADQQEQPDAPPAQETKTGEGFTVEAVVASTVDSVLEERKDDARRFQKQRRKTQRQQEKIHRSNTQRSMDTVEFDREEPSLAEATLRQKRRYRKLRKIAVTVTVLAFVYWIPAVLGLLSVSIPYFSEDVRISAGVYALLHIVACAAGWQTFALGMTHLFQGKVTCHFAVALCNVVTLLDTATMPFLPQRLDAAPLGGISLIALALDLWGECWHAGALKENFRLVALGTPSYVVDLTQDGAVKQHAAADGFYNRTVREDEAIGWQSLLLPVILVASLVFGILASFGQGVGENFLWSWSAILTAGTALSLPFIYSMAYFRLSTRLGKSGCAVAGLYGAKQLSYSKEILIGDEDLFPAGTMKMAGMKLIAEDRRKVAAYAGSLARAYGGTWPGIFNPFMQAEGATPQRLDQFHVHEEGGVSATIHGETVILGIANLIRKMSVRLPKSLEWKDGLFLAIDGELVAIFGVVYEPADSVGWSLGAMRRSGLTPLLATRDPNLHPKFLREYFGTDGGAVLLDLNERLNLSREQHRSMRPNALLYRSGLAPFLEAVAGSKRLCRAVYAANAITLFGCVVGTLLAFYLVFLGRASMLTPPQLLLFLVLWMVPVLLLAWNTDKI